MAMSSYITMAHSTLLSIQRINLAIKIHAVLTNSGHIYWFHLTAVLIAVVFIKKNNDNDIMLSGPQ